MRSSPVTISLPDVNVLLAIVAEGHIHHFSDQRWFGEQEEDSVGICRVTQMGLLRLLTNPKILPVPCSISVAWKLWRELIADKRIFFEFEPPELEAAWSAMIRLPGTGPSSWTDAYLAAFAKQSGYRMVTFDHGFQRWEDLTLELLIPG
jgi:toxin-antitoxin system PIN domain toxin